MDLSFRSRKRSRDDDDFGVRIEGVPADKKQRNVAALRSTPWLREYSEARPTINRAHTLPFRLELAAPPQPPILETTDADEPPTDSSNGDSPPSFMSLPAPIDIADDVDMNMAGHQVSIVGSASPPSHFTQAHPHPHLLRPDKLNSPGLDSFAGRIPTPIHSNFNLAQPPSAPVRSRTDSLLPSMSHAAMLNTAPRFAHAPRKHILEDDYMMPSPIAESPLIEDAMEMESQFPSSQLSRLSVSQDGMDMDLSDDEPLWSSQNGSHPRLPTARSLSASSASGEGGLLSFDVIPPTPTTPGRMGRARSGAFSASNTPHPQQEKGGKRVVFGYRDDCEKCRMRFLGHFAHFV